MGFNPLRTERHGAGAGGMRAADRAWMPRRCHSTYLSVALAVAAEAPAGAEYVQSAQQCNGKRFTARLWSILFTSKKNNG
jgi:hypothetical protein